MMNKLYKKDRMGVSDFTGEFSESEEESDYSEYESDHEDFDPTLPKTDWQGKPVIFDDRYDSFYPISAYKFSRNILKRYKFNRMVAFQKTGYRLPLTRENIKGQLGKIHKDSCRSYDRKGKLVFP